MIVLSMLCLDVMWYESWRDCELLPDRFYPGQQALSSPVLPPFWWNWQENELLCERKCKLMTDVVHRPVGVLFEDSQFVCCFFLQVVFQSKMNKGRVKEEFAPVLHEQLAWFNISNSLWWEFRPKMHQCVAATMSKTILYLVMRSISSYTKIF